MSFIRTYEGKNFHIFEPKVEDVCIGDIAHALSNLCRFAGHSRSFYSVAQHSVLVSRILEGQGYAAMVVMIGLMHDAPEAYIVDLPTPIKLQMPFYMDTEAKIWRCITEKFGIKCDGESYRALQIADNMAFATEATSLMDVPKEWSSRPDFKPYPNDVIPLVPEEAKDLFMKRFEELKGKICE